MTGKKKGPPEKIKQSWRKKQAPPPSLMELQQEVTNSLVISGKGKKGPKKIKQWRKKEQPPPPWVELPGDITANILHRLSAVEILETAQKVCTTWRSVCKDPSFWQVIDMWNLGDLVAMPYDLEKMCRHAVDRSQGQLIDINIEYFGTDELLEYIAERCSQLRCLRIAHCYSLSGEAVSRFPLLEELYLFLTSISSESLEKVGHLCPLLKSFSLNDRGFQFSYDDFDEEYDVCDKEAFAISKSMPNLRHLQLIGNSLTNKGLEAIIAGCPCLESLDLRRCYSLELSGDLLKRCSQQIRSLRCPYDSVADFELYAGIIDNECYSFSDAYEDYLDYHDYRRWDHEDYWDEEDSFFEDIFDFF